MKGIKIILIVTVTLLIGITVGGMLFSRSIARSFLDATSCHKSCFSKKELLGLLASIGIQNAMDNLPKVVYETDKTLVFDIQYPYPPDKIHYVVVPKRDIKDMASTGHEDAIYLQDSFAVIGQIVRDNNYLRYRIITNGPGYQEVSYLHFHLVVDRP